MALKFISFLQIGKAKEYVLYDSIENIPVKLFFEILKTEKLSLLNPQKVKLPKNSNLEDIWNNIVEEYYKESNFKQYRSVLRKIKQIQALKNKLTTCHASIMLLKISPLNNIAISSLASFGYKGKDIPFVERALLKESSRLKLLEKKKKNDNEEQDVNFWQLVADIEEARGFQIDIDNMSLIRWISIIKQIKSKNEKLNKNVRRSKHKSR